MTTDWPFDPSHHYYNRVGEKIDVMEWARIRRDDRTLRKDKINDNPETTLVTVYLGYVDYTIAEARLFGSALITDSVVQQLQVYDSEIEAITSHMEHLEAIAAGHHCWCCKVGREHTT